METKFDIKNIKAIIGLGNPGFKYYKNRHNIGFRIVDEIAAKYDMSWQSRQDLDCCQIQLEQNGELHSIYLIKPLTFMNGSGRVFPFLAKKGINPEEVLVAHDELEKKFGKFGLKFGGSAKGHNGLRSLISVMGPDFWRLCFGIGRPERKEDVGNYVLSDFLSEEEDQVYALIYDCINLLF